ncbi:glucose 1-dehydrogenase [Oryzibacter oryziterrae]|uniref:glucose 1-dehydrogenase n=1 Tax=Oryzibacter oryziterrae TaxID=2766474 RepID=UPI001F0290D2|nr:glucose 1-dehydrogenase [Oryzibacter oryziterrae]
MSQRFLDQVVLVTGGSTGIGLAAAQLFVKEGAKVYITGRNADSLEAARATLGPKAVAVRSDVASLADLNALRDQISAAGDRLDVIVANAGIAERNTFGETDEAAFDKTFDINVKGLFFTVQTMLPLLKDGGSVVLTASIVANKGMPNLSLYNASKAAVRSFARSWSNDLKARRIRVNAVSPGPVETPIMANGLKMDAAQVDGFKAAVAQSAPLGRFGEPEEIADAIAFLASPAASYITGVELSVDGGLAQV